MCSNSKVLPTRENFNWIFISGKSKAKNKKEEPTIKASDQEQPLKVENDTTNVEGSEAHKDITAVVPAAAVVETTAAAVAEGSEPTATEVVDAPKNATESKPAVNEVIENHLEPISDDENLDDTCAKDSAADTVSETAVENGTDSACSSNATSKSASLIKLKYEYPDGTS